MNTNTAEVEKQYNQNGIDKRFKDAESMPSILLWSKIEQKMGPNNAARVARLRKKYSVYRSYIAYAALVVAMIYPVYVLDGLVASNPHIIEQVQEVVLNNLDEEAQQKLVNKPTENDSFDYMSAQTKNVDAAEVIESSMSEKHSKKKELDLVNLEPEAIELNYGGLTIDDTSYFVPYQAKQAKWQINAEGGSDFTNYAIKQKSALFNTESVPNNMLWRFGSFENQMPIVVSIGVERNLSRRLSIRGDLTFYHMKGRSVSNVIQNSYVKKSGELNMAGISLGPEYVLIDRNRFRINLGVSLSAIHTDNSIMTFDKYENGELVKSRQSEVITASSALFTNAYSSVEYAISKRFSVTAKVQLTRPLHNFINELNVYNNGSKYIGGARIGLSYAI